MKRIHRTTGFFILLLLLLSIFTCSAVFAKEKPLHDSNFTNQSMDFGPGVAGFPDRWVVQPGDTFTMKIGVRNVSVLQAAYMDLKFDPELLQVVDAVQLGDDFSGAGNSIVDDVTGTISTRWGVPEGMPALDINDGYWHAFVNVTFTVNEDVEFGDEFIPVDFFFSPYEEELYNGLAVVRLFDESGDIGYNAAGSTTLIYPSLGEGEYRVITEWQGFPDGYRELDVHMNIPRGPLRTDVSYMNEGQLDSFPYASCQADMYYPVEVVTLSQVLQGTYDFLVHDYDGDCFLGVAPIVSVYDQNGKIAQYDYSQAENQGNGDWWKVFTLDGTGFHEENATGDYPYFASIYEVYPYVLPLIPEFDVEIYAEYVTDTQNVEVEIYTDEEYPVLVATSDSVIVEENEEYEEAFISAHMNAGNGLVPGDYLIVLKVDGVYGHAYQVMADSGYMETELRLIPEYQGVAPGQMFTVDVFVENVENLYGAEARIGYDPAFLQVIDADPDTPGTQIYLNGVISGLTVRNEAVVDEFGNGEIWFSMSRSGDINPDGFFGSGLLAQITFQALENVSGGTGIWFSQTMLSDNSDTPEPIYHEVQNANVDIFTAGSIEGYVKLQGLGYREGVRISLKETDYFTTTDYNGYFKLEYIHPGEYCLEVESPDWKQVFLTNHTWPVYVENGQTTYLDEIKLLSGDINSDNRVGLPDLGQLSYSYASYGWDYNYNYKADLNDSWYIDLFDLVLMAKNWQKQGDGYVDIEYGISGIVMDEDEDAISYANIYITGPSTSYSFTADGNGQFDTYLDGPGTYFFVVNAEGYDPGYFQVTLDENYSWGFVDFYLNDHDIEYGISGTVFNEYEEAISYAQIYITGPSTNVSITADVYGQFEAYLDGPGTYSINVGAEGYDPGYAQVTLDEGSPWGYANFYLELEDQEIPTTTINGYVENIDGNPLAGAVVTVSGGVQTNGVFLSTYTDAEGWFSFNEVNINDVNGYPIQLFTVQAIKSGYQTYSAGLTSEMMVDGGLITLSMTLEEAQMLDLTYYYDFETEQDWQATGFWHRLDNGSDIYNMTVPEYVYLPEGDMTEGYVPNTPFGDFAFWYGQDSNGSFIGEQSPYDGPLSGGTSVMPNQGDLLSPVIDLTNVLNPVLQFQSWWEIEGVNPNAEGYDLMTVGASVYEVGYYELGKLNPWIDPNESDREHLAFTSGGFNRPGVWVPYTFDLSTFAGKKIQLNFNFNTGDELYNGFRGWLVDEVRIYETNGASAGGGGGTFQPSSVTNGKLMERN